MVLRKAVEAAQNQYLDVCGPALAAKLSQYAEMLAAQGSLQTAYNYLGTSEEVGIYDGGNLSTGQSY